MRHYRFLAAFALLCVLVYAIGPANAGVANPPTHEMPPNPARWCTATQLVPGTVRTTQIGDCPAPPPSSCPAGRITHGNVRYPNVSSTATLVNVDLRRFENIWGRGTVSEPIVLFPGRSGAVPAVSGWNVDGSYISAEFKPTDPSYYNQIRFSTYSQVPAGTELRLDVSISARCGNFAPPEPHCSRQNVSPGNDLLKIAVAPYANGCKLVAGRTYYLNLRPTNQRRVNGYLSTSNTVGRQP